LIDKTRPDRCKDVAEAFLRGKRRRRRVKERYSGQFKLVKQSGMEGQIAAVPQGRERVAGSGSGDDFFGDRQVAAQCDLAFRARRVPFRVFGLALRANHGGREFTTGWPSKWMQYRALPDFTKGCVFLPARLVYLVE